MNREAEVFDVNNTKVQLIMVLKMQQLNRDEMPSLRYDNLEDYLSSRLWKDRLPKTLNQAADQILHVDARDIVRYLSGKAVIQGSKESLDDFADLIGRN